MNLGADDQHGRDGRRPRRSHRTATGCSSPATVPAGSASPTSTSPTARTSTTISAGRRRPTSAQTSTAPPTTTASTYFENGGHPQLYLRQRPARRAARDPMYVSNLQPDGTWGAGDADSRAQQPGHREPADDPPGRAGDLLLLGSRRGTRRNRSLDIDAGDRSTRPGRRRSTSAPTVNSSATAMHTRTCPTDGQDARLRLGPPRRPRATPTST